MNGEFVDASFARRLAALVVDAGIVLGLSVALLCAAVIYAVGRVPVSETDWDRALSALDNLTLLQYAPAIVYVVWSWTPLAGRRSVGKRALGLRVVQQ